MADEISPFGFWVRKIITLFGKTKKTLGSKLGSGSGIGSGSDRIQRFKQKGVLAPLRQSGDTSMCELEARVNRLNFACEYLRGSENSGSHFCKIGFTFGEIGIHIFGASD